MAQDKEERQLKGKIDVYQKLAGLHSGMRQAALPQAKGDKDASTAIRLGMLGGPGMMEMRKKNWDDGTEEIIQYEAHANTEIGWQMIHETHTAQGVKSVTIKAKKGAAITVAGAGGGVLSNALKPKADN